VLDQTGALISGPGDSMQPGGLDAQQLQYVAQIEGGYGNRIRDILEPIVGRDNLRAQVTAEVDFTQTEATSELFAPNQGPQAQVSIRSLQSSEMAGGTGAVPTGVPGAASNQPPQAPNAPLQGAQAPLQGAQAGAGNSSSRRDAVTNYEIDKTVRVTRNAVGTVKKLNAAVVVNHRSVTDSKGKTSQVALTPDEMDKLTSLVREAVGFDEKRGDSIKVINAPFRVEPVPPVEALPLWKQPEILDLLRAAAVPGALALVAMMVFFGLIRPALKTMAPPPAPTPVDPRTVKALDAVVDDEESLPGAGQALALPAPKADERLREARAIAKQNPAAVAAVVKHWVSGEAAA
jgi:flagellar M-ring protein FliF